MYYKFLFLLSFLLLFSCRKDKTTWDTNWNLPLVNDTLTLSNLVRDSILETNGSGYYQLAINRNLLSLDINENLEIPDTVVQQKYAVSGNLTVQPGFSFITNVKDHSFNVKGALLRRMVVAKGKIKLAIANPYATKTIFTIKLPKVKLNGQSISRTFHAAAGTRTNPSISTETIDIEGYEIDLSGTAGNDYNLLQSILEVQSDPNGNQIVATNLDSTQFSAELMGIKLSAARGYFGHQIFEESSDLNVDFLNKITGGSIDLVNTHLQFIVTNGIKVIGRATLKEISNYNARTNTTMSLLHPQIGIPIEIDGATGNAANLVQTSKAISFTATNSNIENFIENLGSKIQLKYKVELNPYGNISSGWDEFFPQSKLQVRLKGLMPLAIGMNNLTLQDTFKLNFKNEFVGSNVVEGNLKLRVNNAFPLQGQIKLSLLDEFGQLIETIDNTMLIASAGTSSTVGVLPVVNSELNFPLSTATLAKIREVKNVVVRLVLNTPDISSSSQVVTIPEGAFLGLKLGSSFKLATKI